MAQFKPGNRVRCVNDGGKDGLLTDEIYTVADAYPGKTNNFIVLAENGSGYFDWRFVLATGGPYSGIPSTARAIMDLVPERKIPPLTEKQQLQGENIARAVQNLSRHENRLGCAGWEP